MLLRRIINRISRELFAFTHRWKRDDFPGQNVCLQNSRRVGPVAFNLGPGSYANGIGVYGWQQGTQASVGAYCSIAEEVVFLAGGDHDYHCVSTSPVLARLAGRQRINSRGPIRVGNDVWIGHGAILLSGIEVGDGAVIAAGAVVTKDVPPYSIAAGVPARVVGFRFDEHVRRSLLEIRWWDWDQATIECRAADFFDVKTFIAKYHPGR
jgi:acetyltransferase-like isoleucine patch superfamily enzyme